MDHMWAVGQLRAFALKIDLLAKLDSDDPVDRVSAGRMTPENVADELISLDPVMRELMNAARPGFGDYASPDDSGSTPYSIYSDGYWSWVVKRWALRAIGVHELGAEARKRMRPDSPDLIADQFHPWVWDAAAPLWYAGSRQEAIHAAARSVNARLQQKLGRHDDSDSSLVREAFSHSDPSPGHPRLRFPGDDRTSLAWRSRQNGGKDLGAGCFEGIRNLAAHEDGLDLTEQVALEQLAAFSLLARWIEECEVEKSE